MLNLTFRTTKSLDLRMNDFVVFADEKYKLKNLVSPRRISRHEAEYSCKMFSPQYDLQDALYVLEDSTGVGILDDTIPLFGTASFHLQQIVKCVREVHPSWNVGDVEEPKDGKNIVYTDMDCLEALQHMASEFNLEYWITGTTISLGKKKFGSPLLFKYGKGNALYELSRQNQDGRIVTKLLVKGGDRNIDSSTYGSKFLHLPNNERYIEQNVDKFGMIMGRIRFPDVFPRLIHKQPSDPGIVTGVRVDDKGVYWIKDANLDFEPEKLPGKNLVVDFQTGQLGDIKIDANWNTATKEYELIKGDYGLGQDVPGNIFVPRVGDLYLLSDLKMPQAYVDAAERELAERGREAIAQMCEQKVSYKGPVNPLYFRQLGERVETGRAVIVEDNAIVDGGGSVELRVQAFTRGVNDDLSIDIEISDTIYVSRIERIERELQEVKVDTNERIRYGDSYAIRRWRDAEETGEMLKNAQLHFSEAINPIVVRTMQLLVGDESLQFRFVNSKTNPVEISYNITYNSDTKIFRCPAGIIQHQTLGIDTMSPSHLPSEYRFWDMTAFESAPLTESSKSYYVYARVSRTGNTGTFLLSETSIEFEQAAGYYHLWVAGINSEYEGKRSFFTLYGWTEILPGQVFTRIISDPDRNLIIDFLAKKIIAQNGAEIIGKIVFSAGTSGYNNITDKPDFNAMADDWLFDANQYAQQIAQQLANTAQSNATANAILSIDSARNALAQNLGYASYTDLQQKAQAGQTIINGGMIRTALIDANAIVTADLVAMRITASMIAALNITTSRLTVTDGARIGGFLIQNNSLVSNTNDESNYIIMNSHDGKTQIGLGRNVLPFGGFGVNSRMGMIINKNIPDLQAWESGSTTALVLSAMGQMSGESYRVRNRALIANGGVYIGGALCVFDEAAFDVTISNSSGSDANALTYCRKFVYGPGSGVQLNVYLPGRAAIESLITGDLRYPGSNGYLWSGKNVGYQSWIELDILCARYASGRVSVTSPASGTDISDNDGNVVAQVHMEKGDVCTFCYYNGVWYQKKHNS